MFAGFKYRMAADVALTLMERGGVVTKEKLKLMREVTINKWNTQYGAELISQKIARNHSAAAAAVFARLAAMSERTPSGQVTHLDWTAATRYALRNAGASEPESFLGAAALVGEQKNLLETDPWT